MISRLASEIFRYSDVIFRKEHSPPLFSSPDFHGEVLCQAEYLQIDRKKNRPLLLPFSYAVNYY